MMYMQTILRDYRFEPIIVFSTYPKTVNVVKHTLGAMPSTEISDKNDYFFNALFKHFGADG